MSQLRHVKNDTTPSVALERQRHLKMEWIAWFDLDGMRRFERS
jgi:hypothetical protein